MKPNRFSEEKIVSILKEVEAGTKVIEVCRKYGMSDATFVIIYYILPPRDIANILVRT